MPHRIHYISTLCSHIIEGAILAGLAIIQGAGWIASLLTESDWERMTGAHGVAFVSTIAAIVLWGTFIATMRRVRLDALEREVRERKDRKERFDELRESNEHVVNRLIKITEDSHSVILASSRTDMKVAESIHALETQIQHLTNITPRKG